MTEPDAGASRASGPKIRGDVPVRNRNFTGREDILEELRKGSAASGQVKAVVQGKDLGTLPQAVQGLGGVGKTAIAIQFANLYGGDYDLVWWISADQLSSVRASLALLAEKLRVSSPTTAGIEDSIKAVLDALRLGDPVRRWLLIFDNADEPEEINHLIPRGTGDVLITSRNHRWQAVFDTIAVDVFLRRESMDFLRKRVRSGLSEVNADRIADKLGDLPLALEQAGAVLSETGMAADEYLRLMDDHVAGLMNEGKSPDYPMSMTAAWKLSVDKLKEQMPQALELLRCCAFFGPEPIPQNVLRRGELPAGSAVYEVITDPMLMAKAISLLGRYALVTLDGGSLRVHRLIQRLLRDELTEEQQDAYRQEAQLIMATAAPTNPDDARTWSRFRELLPHVNSDSAELPKSSEPAVRDLARAMMRYLYQSGDYASAQALTERFMDQWIKDSGPDSSDVLRAQRHLGNTVRLRGQFDESYRITGEALEKANVTLGEDDQTTLFLRVSFAADMRARGDFPGALKLDGETRPMVDNVYGADDSRSLRLLSSLALDYGLNSDYSTARGLYQDAWRRMSPRSSAATTYDVLGAWIGFAWTLRLLGLYQEAYEVSELARDYGEGEDGLGPEHLSTLRCITGYTIACRRLPEKRLEALELARNSYELAKRRYGQGHPDTLAIAVSLSNLLRTTSDDFHAEALALAISTVDRYPSVYGAKHPYNYGCMSNLGALRRVTGDPAAALEIDTAAHDGLLGTLGPDHHYSLTAAINLASDFAASGQPGQARHIGEDTLRRLTALLGVGHPHTLACANNLALDLMAAGDKAAGTALREATLRRYEESDLGAEFPDTVVAVAGGRLDPDFDPPPI